MRMVTRLRVKLAVALLLPMPAAAHVEWFTHYDVGQPLLPLGGTLGAHFLLVCASFLLLVLGGTVLDRVVARSGHGLARLGGAEALQERLMRAGISAASPSLPSSISAG